METFTHNNERLAYTTTGDPHNPAIMFVHGWTSFRGIWREAVDALSSDFYCVAIDLLGHGDSDILQGADYSIPAQARRVLALADHLQIDQFILIGHSMGGKVALYMAADLAPDRVIKVIDVAGTIKPVLRATGAWFMKFTFDMVSYAPWIFSLLRPLLKYRSVVWLLGGWHSFHDFSKVAPFYWQEGTQYTYQSGMHISLPACLFQAIQTLDLTPMLAEIKCPLLIIFGKQDPLVPVAQGELVNRYVPNSQLVIFDDCKHLPFADQPTAFLAAIKTFLASNTMSSLV